MNKINELLNELNQVVKESQDLNIPEVKQYVLSLIEQLDNEINEEY